MSNLSIFSLISIIRYSVSSYLRAKERGTGRLVLMRLHRCISPGDAAQCPADGLSVGNILTGKPALGQGLVFSWSPAGAGELEVTPWEAEGH